MVTKDSQYILYTDVSSSCKERAFDLWKQGFSASVAQCKFQEWLWNTKILCCVKKKLKVYICLFSKPCKILHWKEKNVLSCLRKWNIYSKEYLEYLFLLDTLSHICPRPVFWEMHVILEWGCVKSGHPWGQIQDMDRLLASHSGLQIISSLVWKDETSLWRFLDDIVLQHMDLLSDQRFWNVLHAESMHARWKSKVLTKMMSFSC